MDSEKTELDELDLEVVWNDKFPPLNLWNWPPVWLSEIFYNQGQ